MPYLFEQSQHWVNILRAITHKKRSAFFVAMNSIQLKPKAIMFEATIETKINLMVSVLPHRRSRYFKAAGTKTIDAINYRHNA